MELNIKSEVDKVGKISQQLFNNKNLYSKSQLPYDNLLLVLVDSILQQGMNYNNFVKPRVTKLKQNTLLLNQFKNIDSNKEVIEYILQTKNNRKILALKEIIMILHNKSIYTFKEFFLWIKLKVNQNLLLSINGIGDKTLDYLLNLVGYDSMPIDRHVYNFLHICGYKTNKYEYASEIFENISKHYGFNKSTLDKEVWQFMRTITI